MKLTEPGWQNTIVISGDVAAAAGEGRRFFPEHGPDYAVELISHRVFATGVVAQTYRVGGRPQYA